MMGFGYGGLLGHWFMGPFVWLAILAIIGLGVYWAIRYGSEGLHAGPGCKDALTILKERYARGEITKAQFRKMKEDVR